MSPRRSTSKRRSRVATSTSSSRDSGSPSSDLKAPLGSSKDELLRERRPLGEPRQAVRRQVQRGLAVKELFGNGPADGRRLHESVAGESACRIEAVAYRSDDRMRIGSHVVEAGPRACEAALASRRIAVRETLEPVAENRLVDDLLEAPTRRGIGHRDPEAIVAS